MIKVFYFYKTKEGWSKLEGESTFSNVVKALRFIHKIKASKDYIFTCYLCFDNEDNEYLSSRV